MSETLSQTITIAVPYYSGFELFLRTLRSIAAQTHVELKVLVCDDSPLGLSRAEVAQVEASTSSAHALRILRNAQNVGMARSWNRCIDESESDLVTIVHADDELDPRYAAFMAALAGAYPDATAFFCGARIIDAEGRDAFSFPDAYKELLVPRHQGALVLSGDRGLASLLRGNYVFCPSLCYRRSRLGALRFDARFRMVLDIDMTTKLLLRGQTLVGIPRTKLYRYRRHDQNATQHLTKELTRFSEEFAFYRAVEQEARRRRFERSARIAGRSTIIRLNLAYCVARDALAGEWSDALKKGRLLVRGPRGHEPSQ